MIKNIVLTVCLAVGLGATACTTRHIVSAEDSTGTGATVLQGGYAKNYFLFGKYAHMFWECKDTGDKLTCYRACDRDDDIDLKCVGGWMGWGPAATRMARETTAW